VGDLSGCVDEITGDATFMWGEVTGLKGDLTEAVEAHEKIRNDGRKILNVDTLLGEGFLSLSGVKQRNICR
jgi:hypothetical protein